MLTIIMKFLLGIPEHSLHYCGTGHVSSCILMCLVLEGSLTAQTISTLSRDCVSEGGGGSSVCRTFTAQPIYSHA